MFVSDTIPYNPDFDLEQLKAIQEKLQDREGETRILNSHNQNQNGNQINTKEDKEIYYK